MIDSEAGCCSNSGAARLARSGARRDCEFRQKPAQLKSMPKTRSKRKPNAAFMRPVHPDKKLSAIVGSKPLPRTEVAKKLWAYIKRNGCQDKKKRTMINADKSLREVFNGKSRVTMFEMTKLVSRHLK